MIAPRTSQILLPLLTLTAGILGMTAIWTTAAVMTRSPQAWLALIVAIDMVLLLRLAGMTASPHRSLLAFSATLITGIASYWLSIASQFGALLGLSPLESALRLGPSLAWDLTRLNGSTSDAIFILAALALAAGWGLGKPGH